MKKFAIKTKYVSTPPGTLTATPSPRNEKVKISLMLYNEKNFAEKDLSLSDLEHVTVHETDVCWINIDGIHDLTIIEQLGSLFKIHPLILEDIITEQRPKLEDYDNHLYIVVKMINFNQEKQEIESEQISLVLCKNYVISFQEKEGDIFNPIRQRIRNFKGKVRKYGADYLTYCLMDSIVDQYFIILEQLEQKIEKLEQKLLSTTSKKTIKEIQVFKKDVIFLKRNIWPLREIISSMQRKNLPHIKESTLFFLRDLYDHSIQIIETIESFRELITGLHDLYISSISNRMNEIMKVLTIISTIFIPLSFIASIYGMNFNTSVSCWNMPELNYQYGYPLAIGLMLLTAIGMLLFFKKKKWF